VPSQLPNPVKFLRGNARASVKRTILQMQRMRAFLEPNWLAQVGQPLNTPQQDTAIDEVIGTLSEILQAVAFKRYKGRA
jgi:hypothetical protein